MKKILLTFAVLVSIAAQAQIKFEKGDWASVLAKATKENKMVMVDFYTTWCGPCKMMERDIFPLKNVGDFYNANFINYKIDAEKGEGVALAQKYGVKAYPTYIFADGTGKFLHQAVGAFSEEKFINEGKAALDPSKQLGNMLNPNLEISKANMPSHLRKLSKDRLPFNDKYEAYITSLSKKELYTEATFDLMQELGGRNASGFTYNLILKNKKKFNKAIGKHKINNYFFRKWLSSAYAVKYKNEPVEPVLEKITALGFDFADKIKATMSLSVEMYTGKGYDAFVDRAKKYIDDFAQNDPSIKFNPVFIEGIKFFHKSPKLSAYTLHLGNELIAENYRAADVNAYLGKVHGDANQLDKSVEYYQKALKIAEANGEDTEMYTSSLAYTNQQIAIQKEGKYTINATGLDKYNGLLFKIGYLSATNIGAFEQTEGVVIKNGKVTVTGKIDTPMPAIWAVYEGDEFKARGGDIILEPGTFPLTLEDNGDFLLDMSTYNYYVYNAWKTTKEYKDSWKALNDFVDAPDYDYNKPEHHSKFLELNKKNMSIIEDYYKNAYASAADPMVKLLVAFEANLYQKYNEDGTASASEQLRWLQQKFPNHYLVKTMEHYIKQNNENSAVRKTVGVGKTIKDFTAKDHDGNAFNLQSVLKNKKYVLVEFWASWCKLCRAEIPHMKKAYSRYKNKGFEIVSFSLDDKKSKWDKAYKDDGITWIDTSDLLAMKSPVVKMYGVVGVPKNYLVDQTGTIIAIDLRQNALDKKLEELLGE